jgi:small subunit ribosomal protein S1
VGDSSLNVETAGKVVPATGSPQAEARTAGSDFVLEERAYTDEEYKDFVKLYDKTLGKISEGEIVKGRIVALNASDVFVDIGFKSEGVVPRSEFTSTEELKVDDEVEVFLESIEDKDGRLVLSRKRADFMKIWERVTRAYSTGELLQGRCIRRIKGGIVVDLMGIDAFLPGSQIDIKPVRDFDQYIGQTLDFRVVKINEPQENVVVSHKVLIEEQVADQRRQILEGLEKGQILEGTVKAIVDFGVFVDLGGVDGLIHITDLSWGRVTHPSEMVKLDQTINVVVLDFDAAKTRISLGLKQLTPHPWDSIEEKYQIGQKVVGKVVSLTDYGAFIEIEKGIEGLIHISEMSWTEHIKHPSQVVAMGQMIDAVILTIDKNDKKISLGIKQLEPDPWQGLLEKYPVASKHTGIVRNLTNFGVFVELESGVDGLVHISDLSWTKKIHHPGEVVKKGDRIDVVILGADLEQRRISLGHKQVNDNPWEGFAETYKVGTETEGKIARLIEKGVIVELPLGVDGFVPASQLSQTPIRNMADMFKVGDTLPLKVIEFDKEGKKIVLSVSEYLKGKEQQVVEDFLAQHQAIPATIGDVAARKEISKTEGKREGRLVQKLRGKRTKPELRAKDAVAPAPESEPTKPTVETEAAAQPPESETEVVPPAASTETASPGPVDANEALLPVEKEMVVFAPEQTSAEKTSEEEAPKQVAPDLPAEPEVGQEEIPKVTDAGTTESQGEKKEE